MDEINKKNRIESKNRDKNFLLNMKSKKAYFFTLDALFALIILLAVILLIPYTHISTVPEKYRTGFLQEDMLKILSTIKTKDINNTAIQGNLSQLDLTVQEALEERDTLLETITKVWASNVTNSLNATQNITEAFFSKVFSEQDNIGLFFMRGDELDIIFIRNNTPWNTGKDIVTAQKFASGVEFGQPLGGYSGRAYLYRKWREKFIYFGGYVGDGEITQRFTLPANVNVSEFVIEAAIRTFNGTSGDTFKIEINDRFIDNYEIATSEIKPLKISLTESQIQDANFSEDNKIVFTSNVVNKTLYIAGGFIKVKYKTPTIPYLAPEQIIFPEIKGVMNLYDSIYIPGNITSMSINLSYEQQANTTPILKIGNVTVWRDTREDRTGPFNLLLTDDMIKGNLSAAGLTYDNISKKTVPIRIGLEEMAAGGVGDVIIVTDVSGSMAWRINDDQGGEDISLDDCGNISDPNNPLFDPITSRLSLARCLDLDFASILLSAPGNRVGLVSYSGKPNNVPWPYVPINIVENTLNLTDDLTAVRNRISVYEAGGATGICAGIREAREYLSKYSDPSRKKFILILTDGLANVHCNQSSDRTVGCGPAECFNNNDNFCNNYGCGSGCNYRVIPSRNVGWRLKPTIAYMNDKWVTIVGGSTSVSGNLDAFEWKTGVSDRWLRNTSFTNGISINPGSYPPAPALAFNVLENGKWNLIIAHKNGSQSRWIFKGYERSGSAWQENFLLVNGLPTFNYAEAYVTPTVAFNVTGNNKWVLIIGYRNSSNNYGYHKGYYWNGSGWQENSSLISGIPIMPEFSDTGPAPTLAFGVANNSKWNLIIGLRNATLLAYYWNGSGWTNDNSIVREFDVNRLPAGESYASPAVAYGVINQTQWYMLIGAGRMHSLVWLPEENRWLRICGDAVGDTAMQHAINEAERAWNNNITVHSVGFGPIAYCPSAQTTLQKIAEAANGSYYSSMNSSELRDKLREIAEEILRLSYTNQTVIVTGNVSSNLTEGYMNINYTFDTGGLDIGSGNPLPSGSSEEAIKTLLGDFMTLETSGFNETTGKVELVIPEEWNPFEAVVVAYSGPLWARYAELKNSTGQDNIVYNLDDWVLSYTLLGDPFRINIPRNIIGNGTNYVTLYFGSNSSHTSMPSNASKVIYTIFKKPQFSYTEAKSKREGCNWTIEGPNGNFTILVPQDYQGSKICNYTNATVGYDPDDVYDTAVYNLLYNVLDTNHDHKIEDANFEAEYDINVILLTGIPFLHYTRIKAMSWR
ncbi:MAG: vWA domain-containing protein [Candidatus Pacearchaeota archaeon]